MSGLFLTFLVPSVLLSALAGVYVDRLDRRTVLVVSNALRAAILIGIFAVGPVVGMLLLLNTLFSISLSLVQYFTSGPCSGFLP